MRRRYRSSRYFKGDDISRRGRWRGLVIIERVVGDGHGGNDIDASRGGAVQ
jgi:hypothetical protein